VGEAKKKQIFQDYLKEVDIIIADKSSASRRRLVKTLCDMGASRLRVHSVAHYQEAIELIDSKSPKFVLSDYSLKGGSGFDLFRHYREKFPDEKKSVLMLVTSNISQSAVAKAAEEDVDSFVIKPYTVQSLEKSFINTVVSKLHPTKYIQTIEAGKEKMFDADYEGALALFEQATELNKKPSLALFYHGQVKYLLDQAQEAEGDYKKGLEINSIHYKCQVGLYELFKKDGKLVEAYSVVRNIAKYFPANPERLKEVVHLAVKTKNYLDMEIYYDVFTELEERTDDVINYICSGLYVCGKYLFMEGESERARTNLEKLSISAAGTTKFLKAVVSLLVEHEIYEDAQKILPRFSNEKEDEFAYKVSSYLANNNDMDNPERIAKGQELFNNGLKDPQCLLFLIRALRAEGLDKKAQQYSEEAEYLFPDYFAKQSLAA
tara:strand:+ start:4900 stop:6201 length:1302 start_codon:yes stop_codon:yes gene_type:complete